MDQAASDRAPMALSAAAGNYECIDERRDSLLLLQQRQRSDAHSDGQVAAEVLTSMRERRRDRSK